MALIALATKMCFDNESPVIKRQIEKLHKGVQSGERLTEIEDRLGSQEQLQEAYER